MEGRIKMIEKLGYFLAAFCLSIIGGSVIAGLIVIGMWVLSW